jgi:hypothetical protein
MRHGAALGSGTLAQGPSRAVSRQRPIRMDTAAHVYWENKASIFNAVDVSIPAAVSIFPGELYQAPRSWTELAYHKLIHYNRVEKGGHFAAWEQPQLFSDVRRPLASPQSSRRTQSHERDHDAGGTDVL